MRVCVCLGHNKRRRQRRKGERRQAKRDGKKWAKGWPHPHLTLPCLGLAGKCEICGELAKHIRRQGRTCPAGRWCWHVPCISPFPPSPHPAAHAYRLPPLAMYVCVCWQVLGFLFVCHRAHFDVIWCCYARKNACTHTRSTMSVSVWVAACHIALFAGRRQCKWGGTRMYVNHMPWAIIAAATQPEIKQAKMLQIL